MGNEDRAREMAAVVLAVLETQFPGLSFSGGELSGVGRKWVLVVNVGVPRPNSLVEGFGDVALMNTLSRLEKTIAEYRPILDTPAVSLDLKPVLGLV